MAEQPRVPAGSPHGGRWAKQIGSEISTLRGELAKHTGLFSEASLVGSFGGGGNTPDRRGSGTSDLDVMILPRGVHATPAHWDAAAKIEKAYQAKHTRPIHLNLEPVADNSPSVKIWTRHGLMDAGSSKKFADRVKKYGGKKFDAITTGSPDYKNRSGMKSAEEIARHEDRLEMTKWVSEGFSAADVTDELKRREKVRKK